MNDSEKKTSGMRNAVLLSLAALSGIGLRLFLSQAMRSQSIHPGSTAVWTTAFGAIACTLAFLGAFARIVARKENLWGWYPGIALLFILLYEFRRYRPEIASLELPLALFFFVPAGTLSWLFMGHIRSADELQQRILSESLGFSFVATLIAVFVYSMLEDTGLLRFSPIWVAIFLVGSLSLGVALASRRYE